NISRSCFFAILPVVVRGSSSRNLIPPRSIQYFGRNINSMEKDKFGYSIDEENISIIIIISYVTTPKVFPVSTSVTFIRTLGATKPIDPGLQSLIITVTSAAESVDPKNNVYNNYII
ncbi:hypothetical protein ALC62_16005, partial [Cyphomyrmex costatus]